MDTKKIREALEAVNEYFSRVAQDERVTGWVHREDYGLYCLLADPDCGPQVDEALAELDAAPKVLTDEEPYRVEKSSGVYVIVGPNGRWSFHFHDEGLAHIRARDFNRVHKIARDNGYLAPAAGLTVEEAVKAVRDCYAAMGWTQHHDEEDLRARLTAAIQEKTSK